MGPRYLITVSRGLLVLIRRCTKFSQQQIKLQSSRKNGKYSRAIPGYADHETCRAALKNPDPGVRAIALSVLKDFAESGDPFSIEILQEHSSD